MTWSLQNRVLASMLLVACFTAVLSTAVVWTYVTNVRAVAEQTRATRALTVQQIALVYLLPVGRKSNDWTGLDQAVTRAAKSANARVIVTQRSANTVLADSSPNSASIALNSTDAVINPAFDFVGLVDENGNLRESSTSSACGDRCFDPVEGSSPPVRVLVIPKPSNRGLGFDLLGTMTALVAVILAAGLLSVFVSRRVTQPLVALTSSVARLGRGDVNERFDTDRAPGEVAFLGREFNSLASSLQSSERARAALIADVAHELRNPIGAILGNLEAAQDGLLEPDSALLGRLHDEATHLTRLTDDLQQLTLADAGKLTITRHDEDIEELIRETVLTYSHLARQREIILTVSIPSPLSATVDRTRIRQVLDNLIKNALTYTPVGGTVLISAALVEGDLQIIVEDNGVGVSQEDQKRIFDRFWRADPSRNRATGGTGVGLAITKALVEAHHGQITVASAPGQGTRFTITLP